MNWSWDSEEPAQELKQDEEAEQCLDRFCGFS